MAHAPLSQQAWPDQIKENMMNATIVRGIDESTGSRHAASFAARLARDLDTHAVLVHVTGAGGIADRLAPTRPGRTRRARMRLRAVADEHCLPAATRIRLKSGNPADATTVGPGDAA